MRIGRYILSGVLTALPLLVTWFVLDFLFRQLSQVGRPVVRWIADRTQQYSPEIAAWIRDPWVDDAIAVIVILIGLYILGWFATRVIGRRLIEAVEVLVHRVPLVQTIYGAVKTLVEVMQKKPEGAERVVLVEFPSRDMRAVGLVTRVMTEQDTGRKLAVVYVPTTPNPTSGYMEIVPLENVVPTDWTLDEAMNFIISAGAIAPENIKFSNSSDDIEAAMAQVESAAAVVDSSENKTKIPS